METTKKIKITNKELVNVFFRAFNDLSKLPSNSKSGKLKYAIKRSLPSIQAAVESFEKKRVQIFEDRAKVDENGNPKFDENGNYLFDSKEIRKDAFNALHQLEEEEIEIEIYPVSINDITAVAGEISIAQEINLGEFIILEDN